MNAIRAVEEHSRWIAAVFNSLLLRRHSAAFPPVGLPGTVVVGKIIISSLSTHTALVRGPAGAKRGAAGAPMRNRIVDEADDSVDDGGSSRI